MNRDDEKQRREVFDHMWALKKRIERNELLPRPISYALSELHYRRYRFCEIGYLKVGLYPETTMEIEGYVKGAIAQVNAIAETYPAYANELRVDESVLSSFDDLRALGAQTKSGQISVDEFLDGCQAIMADMNSKMMAPFQNLDREYGTYYMPSEEFINDFNALIDNTKEQMRTIAARNSHKTVSDCFPMLMASLSNLERSDMDYQMEHSFREKILDRGLSTFAEEALVGLAIDRHRFHARGFVQTFLHPDDGGNDLLNLIVDFYLLRGCAGDEQSFLMPDFDINEYVEQMKELGVEAAESAYRQPELTDIVSRFCDVRNELDDKIVDYLKTIDEELGCKIAPSLKKRENSNLNFVDRSVEQIQRAIETEQRKTERKMARNRRYAHEEI